MTVGPWKPIKLETYESRISDVDIRSKVAEDLSATVDVTFNVSDTSLVIATVLLKRPNGATLIGASNIKVRDGVAHTNFGLSKGAYEPWYPVGYGNQPIYTIEITMADEVSSYVAIIRHMCADSPRILSKVVCLTHEHRKFRSVVLW